MRLCWRISLSLVLTFCCVPPAHAQGAAPSAFDSAKARALLRERLPCLGCHVIDGAGGRIGPDLTAVATRRSAVYIASMIENPQTVVPGSAMPRVPMPPAMRMLITQYLTGSTSIATGGAAPALTTMATPTPTTGPLLYARYCAACHGDRGDGTGPNARYLPVRPVAHADAALMSGKTDDRLFDAIAGGGYPLGRSSMMPAFGATLSRAQMHLLVRHLRALCRCAGPVWSRAHEAGTP